MQKEFERLKSEGQKLKNFDSSFAKSNFQNVSTEDLKTCLEIVNQMKTIRKNEGDQAALKI